MAGLTLAFLGLGGNLGDPAAAMAVALQAIDAHDAVAVVDVSSLYRTPPWGITDQPDFLNAVAAVETSLSGRALLDVCLAGERALKRVRAERWGPRVIDVDVLLYGNQTIDEEGLQVPHPRMAARAFVLAPLAEIAPDTMVSGHTAASLLQSVEREGVTRLPGGRDWWRARTLAP